MKFFFSEWRVVIFFVQICVRNVRNDQWMLTEVVPFVNNNGGKIQLNLFKAFLRLSGDSDWTFRLMKNGDDEIKRFCENSNGELTWATDDKGEVTVSTKFSKIERLQAASRSSSATVTVPSKVTSTLTFSFFLN